MGKGGNPSKGSGKPPSPGPAPLGWQPIKVTPAPPNPHQKGGKKGK